VPPSLQLLQAKPSAFYQAKLCASFTRPTRVPFTKPNRVHLLPSRPEYLYKAELSAPFTKPTKVFYEAEPSVSFAKLNRVHLLLSLPFTKPTRVPFTKSSRVCLFTKPTRVPFTKPNRVPFCQAELSVPFTSLTEFLVTKSNQVRISPSRTKCAFH